MGDKYICTSCWHTFMSLYTQQSVQMEHFGTPCYEEMSVCPVCLSGAVAEIEHCSKCGDSLTNDFYITNDLKHLCEYCSPVSVVLAKEHYRRSL